MTLELAKILALAATGGYEVNAALSNQSAALILSAAVGLADPDNWEGASYILTANEIDTIADMVAYMLDEVMTQGWEPGNGEDMTVAVLSDVKSQNTHGGTFTLGAWRTRTLQTEVDPGSIVTLASDQFTLIPGTFFLIARVPGYAVLDHQARLYNVTGDSLIKLGSSLGAASTGYGRNENSFIFALFEIAASQALEIQHKCVVTNTGDGFGKAANISSEIYTEVLIVQVE